jgi:DNA-directed RNA polymerase specialized sigma24 family protein
VDRFESPRPVLVPYALLLRRRQEVAFRAAYLITGSSAEADEATQEACVEAWLAL